MNNKIILALEDYQAEIIKDILLEYGVENPENRNSNIAYYVANTIIELLKSSKEERELR